MIGTNVAVVGNFEEVVRIGDLVLIQPDGVGVSNDVMQGYTLGINIAEVIGVPSKQQVEVEFFFAKSLGGLWHRWLQKPSGERCYHTIKLTKC